jgi:hypothetical protein
MVGLFKFVFLRCGYQLLAVSYRKKPRGVAPKGLGYRDRCWESAPVQLFFVLAENSGGHVRGAVWVVFCVKRVLIGAPSVSSSFCPWLISRMAAAPHFKFVARGVGTKCPNLLHPGAGCLFLFCLLGCVVEAVWGGIGKTLLFCGRA